MYRPTRVQALLVLIGLSLNPASIAQDLPAVFDQVVHTVVEIHVQQLVVTGTTDKQPTLVASQGSGVLVSADGKIITVAHPPTRSSYKSEVGTASLPRSSLPNPLPISRY